MEIQIANRTAEIELISKEGNVARLLLDNQEYEVDITMLEENAYSILHNGKSYNAEVLRSTDNRNEYEVNTAFSAYNVKIIDTQAKYLRLKRNDNDNREDKIISPMPGKIIGIPVKVGDTLSPNDTVIVIEAMKMQNNYKVSTHCTVKEILVSEGDTVSTNQLLIQLQPIIEQEQ